MYDDPNAPRPTRISSDHMLSDCEQRQLAAFESTIADHLVHFVKVGNALLEIRDSRLYRELYDSFETYCASRWNISRTHAYRLMAAADVAHDLGRKEAAQAEPPLSPNGDTGDDAGPIVPLPANEAQARPLSRLSPAERRAVWQRVIATAPAGGVTAAHVDSTVRAHRERKERAVTRPVDHTRAFRSAEAQIRSLEDRFATLQPGHKALIVAQLTAALERMKRRL